MYSAWIILILTAISCASDKQTSNTTLFTLVSPRESGVDFVNKLTETKELNAFTFNYMYNGAGVAIGDINNDGLSDIYFTGNQVPDRLYINKGDLQFEDISLTAGIQKFKGWKNGVNMVDINADGYLDIYVTRGGAFDHVELNKNLLFINQKNNTFKEEAKNYGIDDPGYSMATTFFDYDNDGDLDLYLANRPSKWPVTDEEVIQVKAQQIKGIIEPKTADKLYRNNGNLTFTDVSKESGIYPNYGYGLSVTEGDINQDGWDDLYVANDFVENDYLYVNTGKNSFKEKIHSATNHVPFYSMGADMGDINNDGYEEIFIVEMRPDDYVRSKMSMPPMQASFFEKLNKEGFANQYMHNVLQYNHGNGFLTDISQLAHVDKTDWSWAALISDFDNDGFKDFYVTNGYKRDVYDRDSGNRLKSFMKTNKIDNFKAALELLPEVKLVNYIFKNNGDLTFKKNMSEWGMQTTSFSNGAAVGDLDNDGDLDLVVNNIDDPAFLYKNNGVADNHYLRIKLEGPSANLAGLGSKITLIHSGTKQFVQLRTSRGYLSCSEPIAHFGLDDQKIVDEVHVRWMDGKTNVVKNVSANQTLIIKYSEALEEINKATPEKTYFTDVTSTHLDPPFIHSENIFNDFQNQILLPHRMSRLGPFVCVGDINGDKREDFFVGGAKNQAGKIYVQQVNGHFKAISNSALEKDKSHEDLGCIFHDFDKDGDLDLYVVSGGSEEPEGSLLYQDRLYTNNGKGNFEKSNSALPITKNSGSCIVPFDYDGDGDTDLFRGSRVIPDKYPYPPNSYLFENTGKGNFKDVTESKGIELKNIGMVTSACWTNLDQDEGKELVVVGEWMPVTIFKIQNGIFKKTDNQTWNLENSIGWWNVITAFDMDKDGDQDLLAGNLGTNYKFHASKDDPFHVYCNDYDGNGTFDIVLAKNNKGTLVPVRGRQCSSEQMPFIANKYPDYTSFANANLNDIYGELLSKGLHYEAYLFESVQFINSNNKFDMIKLPNEAQFSTIQNFVLHDFNSDSIQDLLIAGNLFGSEVETTRADGSIGQLFIGGGNGTTLKAISSKKSGVFLPGDVKDLKAIRVGNKIGILATSNNGALSLLQQN